MIFSNDVAITIAENQVSTRSLKSEAFSFELPPESDLYDPAFQIETLEVSFRQAIQMTAKHRSFVPPKVLICAYFRNEIQRRAIKDAAIHAGAREVWLLERPMAIGIGHETEQFEAQGRRIYLLWEPSRIEVSLLDTMRIDRSLVIFAERHEHSNRTSAESTLQPYSLSALQAVQSYIVQAQREGYSTINLWSPQELPGEHWDFLAEAAPNLEVTNPSALLNGAFHVLKDLKYFFK
ncbi:rod shape-determining protein [Cerasicoccus frondis]|uniref:rod shape-determining protein n=1 Tax=Cerasicoccus frondis TaxID=490090 RepID=UPI002852849D|nr:rod shape-determining protein [Cerasicoccus frondis]